MTDQPEDTAPKPWTYVPPDEAEKRRLAAALVGNTVFTSQHIPERDGHLLRSIFMPVLFGAFAGMSEEDHARVQPILYEYLDQAGPRSVNGYPIFFSLRVIGWDDWIEVCKRAEAARAALGGTP